MIDFACKQFNLNEIIKCGLNLTKAELKIFNYFLHNPKKEGTTSSISKKLNLNLTTIQKGVKKLFKKGVIIRHQKNLSNGGYLYTYECNSKTKIKSILKGIISNWSKQVEKSIERL